MSNTKVPPLTLESMWATLVASNDIRVAALDGSIPWDDSFEFFGDLVASRLGDSSAPLSGTDFTAGAFTADNTEITSTVDGDIIVALVVYADTGVDATSPILVYIDTNADTTDMTIESDGTTGTVSWPVTPIAQI